MTTDSSAGSTPGAYLHDNGLESTLHDRAAQLYKAHLATLTPEDLKDPAGSHRRALAAVADDARDIGRALAVAEFVKRYNADGINMDPDQFGSLVWLLSDLAQKSYRRSLDDPSTPTRADNLQHALGTVLDLTSALACAFSLPGLPNGAEFRALYRDEDVTTADCDELRLHVLSVHANLAALRLTDREVKQHHHEEHFGPCGLRNHDYTDRTWSPEQARQRLDEDDDAEFRAANHLVLDELIARLRPAPAEVGSHG